MSQSERRLAAIMFTDIVGYTSLTQSDESRALALLEKHRAIVRPVLAKCGGREVKTIGDAFLVEFNSALEAIECAAELQRALYGYNEKTHDNVVVRIGIHVGDVVHKGGDVYGDAVNVASRIQPLAEPGGICISEEVYSLIRNKVAYAIEMVPAVSLKNVELPMNIYAISPLSLGVEEKEGILESGSNRLAVLPLSNISPDPKDAYFADGMTEELITVLSQVQGLRVIARTSVDRYSKKDKGVSQIARELKVGSVMEGSVRMAGDRIRITVQLIDGTNEEHLWSENYDRRLDDIFAIQSDVAKRVAEALKVKLLAREEERLDRRGTANMNAYSYYLNGRALLAKRKPSEMIQAKELFEKAISEDPTYTPAYAGLSDAYYLLGDYWTMPVEEARRKSKGLLSQALKLDPDLPEARARLAMNLAEEYRFADAVPEFRHAIGLNPSYAISHMWYASCLGALRRYEEQLEELEIAEQLDPLSTVVLGNEIMVLALLGRKESARQKVRRMSELDPGSVSTVDVTSFYHYLAGDPAHALSEVEKHPELHNEFPIIGTLPCISLRPGQRKRR